MGWVLNNARFLIRPWVQVKNLASKVLSLTTARVAADFPQRYGKPVVLLETFVEPIGGRLLHSVVAVFPVNERNQFVGL